MVKTITFGASKASIIDEYEIKQKVVDFLYSCLNLSNYRYVMLTNVQKLEELQKNEHYVSPSFKGFNYLIIFLKVDGKLVCAAIDRKKLSYHKNQLDMKQIFIIKLFMRVSESVFNGTIFDGKLIDNKIFLIQDCYYSLGENLLNMEMNQKMNYLDSILKSHFTGKPSDNFIFKLNKLYTYTELEDLIKNIIPQSKLGIQGLAFYPKTSGINILHIEKKIDKIEIEGTKIVECKSYNMINNFVDFLKSRTYSYEKGKQSQMYISKTNITDVYDVYDLSNNKVGIAHIPSLKISHYCDEHVDTEMVKFNCVFDNKFKKWIPLSKV